MPILHLIYVIASKSDGCSIDPVDLSCEYLREPRGLSITQPRETSGLTTMLKSLSPGVMRKQSKVDLNTQKRNTSTGFIHSCVLL